MQALPFSLLFRRASELGNALTRAETNRAFPTNQFRQRRRKVWEPQVVLAPDAVQERMRKTIDYMVHHAIFMRDQVILLLIRQTGARLSEVLEMTAGGYRAARHPGHALVKNKGSRGREERLCCKKFDEGIACEAVPILLSLGCHSK